MKKITLITLLLIVTFGFSQITNQGNPKSWSTQNNQQITNIKIPTIDLQRIVQEDASNDKLQGKPYRVGIVTKVNLGFNQGKWFNLENGDRFWRLNISSKDALHLSVNFDDFYLPKGANLYLYNNDKTDLLGAYTSINNNNQNTLGSWFVMGDNLWIEYFEPANVNGQGKLHINNLIHGYRLNNQHQSFNAQKNLNDSGACNQDVDCFVGADFEPTKNELKHAVAFLNMGNGFVCSGSLINNVNNDKTPYFLTANHCYLDNNGNPSNPAAYSMRFNWITSGTPRCASFNNSANGPTNFVMNGSVLRAKHATADFMLVELNNNIPASWNIRFAGWDRTDTNPVYEVGIHHPIGDIMKVCRDDNGAVKTQTGGVPIWLIGGINAGNGNGWELGVTEGGSSGSPLFNQDGRIIGQLWAGAAECVGTNDNNDYDFYGRLAASWTGGGSNNSRLRNWLDPNNTGTTTINMLNNAAASINDTFLANNINIYPNPTKGNLEINFDNLSSKFNITVSNILGQVLLSKNTENTTSLSLNHLSNAFYFVKITDTNTNSSFTTKIILQK